MKQKLEITSERVAIKAIQVDRQRMTRLTFRQVQQVAWKTLDLDIMGYEEPELGMGYFVIPNDYYIYGEFLGYVDLNGDEREVWLVYERSNYPKHISDIMSLKRTLVPKDHTRKVKNSFDQLFIGT